MFGNKRSGSGTGAKSGGFFSSKVDEDDPYNFDVTVATSNNPKKRGSASTKPKPLPKPLPVQRNADESVLDRAKSLLQAYSAIDKAPPSSSSSNTRNTAIPSKNTRPLKFDEDEISFDESDLDTSLALLDSPASAQKLNSKGNRVAFVDPQSMRAHQQESRGFTGTYCHDFNVRLVFLV
jgi:hypothetical protein